MGASCMAALACSAIGPNTLSAVNTPSPAWASSMACSASAAATQRSPICSALPKNMYPSRLMASMREENTSSTARCRKVRRAPLRLGTTRNVCTRICLTYGQCGPL